MEVPTHNKLSEETAMPSTLAKQARAHTEVSEHQYAADAGNGGRYGLLDGGRIAYA